MRNSKDSTLYFDYNGTTFVHPEVIDAVVKGFSYGNASADYSSEGKKLLAKFRAKVKTRIDNPNVKVVITSGASESNNTFLRSMAEMFPGSHFILSAIEHGTSLECAKRLKELGQIKLSLVYPRVDGCIHLADIKKLVRKNTRVISVIHFNNETGSINDIEGIGRFCRRQKPRIFYHADTVQSFGKYKLPGMIDAYSVSFHKMYGPQGVGCLILDRDLIRLGFQGQIMGTQNFGLRGGTENLAGVSGALKAMEITFTNRVSKNLRLRRMKNLILTLLARSFKVGNYQDYYGLSDHFRGYDREWTMVQVGGDRYDGKDGAPNVLLLSFLKSKSDPHHFCNVKAKKCLLKRHCLVSIGSACHTKSSGPSHVLRAMKAPFIIRCGVIRISLGDLTTEKDCRELVEHLEDCILRQG